MSFNQKLSKIETEITYINKLILREITLRWQRTMVDGACQSLA